MEISIQQLRAAADLLLRHVEEVNGDRLTLDEDFFWVVDASQMFNVQIQPTSHTIGSLADSAENVVEMLEGTSPTVSYGLVWLADLLQAVGRTVVR